MNKSEQKFLDTNRMLNNHLEERKILNLDLREKRKEKYNLTLSINKVLNEKRNRLKEVVWCIMKESEELVKQCQKRI